LRRDDARRSKGTVRPACPGPGGGESGGREKGKEEKEQGTRWECGERTYAGKTNREGQEARRKTTRDPD